MCRFDVCVWRFSCAALEIRGERKSRVLCTRPCVSPTDASRLLAAETADLALSVILSSFMLVTLLSQTLQQLTLRAHAYIPRSDTSCVLGKTIVMVLLCHSSECGCFVCFA